MPAVSSAGVKTSAAGVKASTAGVKASAVGAPVVAVGIPVDESDTIVVCFEINEYISELELKYYV